MSRNVHIKKLGFTFSLMPGQRCNPVSTSLSHCKKGEGGWKGERVGSEKTIEGDVTSGRRLTRPGESIHERLLRLPLHQEHAIFNRLMRSIDQARRTPHPTPLTATAAARCTPLSVCMRPQRERERVYHRSYLNHNRKRVTMFNH